MHPASAAIQYVFSQQRQDFTVLPPLRHGSVCWLESADGLSPLTTPWCTFPPRIGLGLVHCFTLGYWGRAVGIAPFGRLSGGGRWLLSSPIVYVPIILVKENIVLLELFGGHERQIGIGEGGEEQVTFESPPFAALI